MENWPFLRVKGVAPPPAQSRRAAAGSLLGPESAAGGSLTPLTPSLRAPPPAARLFPCHLRASLPAFVSAADPCHPPARPPFPVLIVSSFPLSPVRMAAGEAPFPCAASANRDGGLLRDG